MCANQTSGQTPSQSDDNSQMVRKENVKTRSGRDVKIPARFDLNKKNFYSRQNKDTKNRYVLINKL